MPVDIIPQSMGAKKRAKISVVDILYYLTIIFLVFSFLAYIGLIFLYRSSETKLNELTTAIQEKETPQAHTLETKILEAKQRIEVFANLISNHCQSSNLFSFLAQKCHQQAFFSDLKLNLKKQELVLGGKTESFKSLAEQMLILSKEEMIKDLSLNDANIGKEGNIEFELLLNLNPLIFKYK